MSGLTVTDPFAALLNVVDARMRKFGPDRTAVMGFYGHDGGDFIGNRFFQLDNGQRIPNPVVTSGVLLNTRCVGVWMQDGHDIFLLPLPSPISSFMSVTADHGFSYPGGRTQIRFQPGGVLGSGISVFTSGGGFDLAYLMPAANWSLDCAFDPGEAPAVPDPLGEELRTIEIEARTPAGALLGSWSNTQSWPRIGTPGLGVHQVHNFTGPWVLRCFVTFGVITLAPATMKPHVGSDLFPTTL